MEFTSSEQLAADLKQLDYATVGDQIKPEHDIKMEMADAASFSNYFNPKTMINSNYDTDMYSSFYKDHYNSDYQPKYVK